MTVTPQELVEHALTSTSSDGCVVILATTTSANLRWANNTLTTNGVMHHATVTVVATKGASTGAAAGVVTGSAGSHEQITTLVEAADAAAAAGSPAEEARPLVEGEASATWSEPPGRTTISVFDAFAPALGEAFGRARDAKRLLYGYVEHEITTTYLGSSTGLRLRHEQPSGHIGITGKDSDLTRSAWVGQGTRDFTDVDALALDAELERRLGWAARSVDLPAGRYETLLPPTSVADLMIYMYWSASARDSFDGRSVFSRPGGGTRVGDSLSSNDVRLFSDPMLPGLECSPFVVAGQSTAELSVFDNGLPVSATDWVSGGKLASLLQTRHSADLTSLPVTPAVDNLALSVDGSTGSIEDLVARTERGLLLTCLWYIREVDPQTLLLTGLTRDGVYLVENGEVTGAVNNFRFNESPVDLLGRFSEAGATVPTISREWGDYFPRTAMPALRVPDFNMSSVSQAS
ncbi:MAG TPA: metallopeptidase TldD-related protein [Nocardioidaceae bacterium]|nr:metallopeptidase TldD-related protein [Nocardioidaceae bacterium]